MLAECILRASKVRRWLEFEPGGGNAKVELRVTSFHPVISNPVFTPPRP